MAPNLAAVVRDDGCVVCESCRVAATFATRLRGLLGRRHLRAGDGLLIRPAGSIHTLFMRFAIDVVFLDRNGRVLKVVERVRPWRLAVSLHAKETLELAAGEAAARGLHVGDRLSVEAAAR